MTIVKVVFCECVGKVRCGKSVEEWWITPLPYCMNVSRHAQIVADGQWASRIMSSVSSTSPSIAPSIADSESSGVNEPISRSPYSAKLLGRSDEELASSDFFRLVDAIRWLTEAEQNGAIARRAGIYSATGELVWARAFAAEDDQRQRVMKYNALRILFQID